jgi:hypothetical protein
MAPAAEARDAELIGARVKSASWRILRKPHRIEIFEGDVRYIKPERKLRADWARFDHGTGVYEAKGSIEARQRFRDGTWLEVFGDEAVHMRETGDGTLKARDRVRFSLSGSSTRPPGNGSARLLRWQEKLRIVTLSGDVRFDDPRGLELTGLRPVLTGRQESWSSAVQADTITAQDLENGRRKITGTGSARGWIFFDGPARESYH